MVLWRRRPVVLDHEQRGRVLLHVEHEVVDVVHQQLDTLLVERGVGEHPSQLDEEAEEVDGAVEGGGRPVRVLLLDVGVLLAFELVQQLGAEHHVEVLEQAGCDLRGKEFICCVTIII